MTRFTSLALVSLVVATAAFSGENPTARTRKSWEWTNEERIAARSNPIAAAARVAAHEAREGKPSKMAANAVRRSNIADVIDGTANPELLMPSEVFNSFLKKMYLSDARYEERFAATRAAIGLPSNFAERLSVVAGPYIKELREQHARGVRASRASAEERTRVQNEENASSAIRCGLLSDALAAARAEFGAEKFDQYLYTVAAPSIVIFTDRLDDAVSLRHVAGGCR